MSVSLLEAAEPCGILLFAPGAGGALEHYRRLLASANAAGFIVAAPEHEPADVHTEDILRERVTALRAPLDAIGRPDLPVVASGHSLGGFAALCLAGAHPSDPEGAQIDVPSEPRVSRVVVLAPAMRWFDQPGALADVTVSITAFVGARDVVTPHESAGLLRSAPGGVDLRRYDDAGHMDFMSPVPPDTEPTPGLDQEAFFQRFAEDFVASLR